MKNVFYILTLSLSLLPTLLHAHEANSLPYGPFLSGITHPVLGLDHFLAMVSVGMVSAQIGGSAIWKVPATFVAVMFLGGLLGINISGFGGYEIGIAMSVLLLGLVLVAERTISASFAMTAVGIFAVFHGYAHGGEIPTVAEPVPYVAGFMTGTILLHITGLILADISIHYKAGRIILRTSGCMIAISGCYFLINSFS